jgi:hypothetical protein
MAKQSVYTEVDIVRHIVKDLIENLKTDGALSDNLQDEKKELFKLYMRIWVSCMRQVRGHCERFDSRPIEIRGIGHVYKDHKSQVTTFVPAKALLEDAKVHIGEADSENQASLSVKVSC